MNIKKCCDRMGDEGELRMNDDGNVDMIDTCCGCSFDDWKFCHFCGKRYERE